MQQTLFVFIIEVLLLLLVALIIILLRNWRKKVSRIEALETMIDDFKDNQGLRRKRISVLLTGKCPLDNEITEHLSEQMIVSEKKFLLRFIEQQMVESVDGFYENLCELLDDYLHTILTNSGNKLLDGGVINSLATLNTGLEKKVGTENEPQPDWGDVFD